MSNALPPFQRQSHLRVIVAILCAYVLTGPVALASADPPQRDPAGIATGDKTTTSDAGGNAFVVAEPSDKNAPDYVKSKQAFDEFQAQASREPLAVKLADNVGHLRVATN